MIRLEQQGGPLRFDLMPGRTVVLGRGEECDLVVADAAVSRRHAELAVGDAGLEVTDLESANGVRLNGARIQRGRAGANDLLTFGGASFLLLTWEPATVSDAPPPRTIVRSLVTAIPARDGDRREVMLRRLLELAAGLSGDLALERFLDELTALTFDQVDADRAVLLLAEAGDGPLTPAAARTRGAAGPATVPRSIAERAVRDRAPVVTAHAPEDERFQSGSVAMLQVRSAICAPLLADDDRVLGVLYADTITRAEPFSDDEAGRLMAFAGLAAAALGRARLAAEARRDRELRRKYERFFAPEVAAAIAAAGPAQALAGGRRDVVVLFSDLRGFTGMAERLSPEDTARLLGDYFTVMVDAVFRHGGTLDKFTGDGVMAVWGAPLPSHDAADRALRAARDMRRGLAGLDRSRSAAGQPVVQAGIGIAFGPVFAGNVGTADRLEYTVVGDPVNVAARLCEAAAGGEVLLDRATAERLSVREGLSPGHTVAVRGRREAVETFRLVEEPS